MNAHAQPLAASPGTSLLLRLEYLLALTGCIALGLLHVGEIRWGPYLLLFAYIDLVGYLPGLLAQRRAPGQPIAPIHYALYNTTHSFLFNAGLAAAWCLTLGPEWALLALPTHLCGDRSLFGNMFKSRQLPFEGSPA